MRYSHRESRAQIMANAYFTIEKQEDGFWSIWYNNGTGTSCTIAENIGDKANAEKMKDALNIDSIEK